MNVRGTVLLGMMIALAGQPIQAEPDQDALFEQRLAEAQARLDLSDEQLEQVKPVMKAGFEAQRSVLSRYGIELDEGGPNQKIGMREGRKLRSEMGKVRSETLEQLKGILTEQQLDEYKKLQDERQEEMKQRIRGGR